MNEKKEMQMKLLLKTLKTNKQHFAVPEPDADFERRMLKSLRDSKEWNRVSLWERLNIFRFELSVWRLSAVTCAVLLVLGSVKYFDGSQKQLRYADRNSYSHPELVSMLQKGGAKAFDVWTRINGDLASQNDPEVLENAPLGDAEQKRVLAELEKKWAPAL